MTNVSNTQSPLKRRMPTVFWTSLGLAWELGYMIAGPLVLFALVGRWLDNKMATSPWFLLGGMAIAVTTTTIFLVRKFSRMMREVNSEEQGPKQ